MTKESLIDLIENTLEIPVFEGSQSIIYPAATLEIIGQPATLIGDGKAKIRESEVVINLWYTEQSDRDADQALLLAALDMQDGISVPECNPSYDTTAKKFRSVISFNFIPR
jgi:hypothetical protein